jgi:hypothetical protein
MRTLRHVELYLGSTYPEAERKWFLTASRSACNFLERHLQLLQFKSPYSRVNIFCLSGADEDRVLPYKHEPYLEVHIPFAAKPAEQISRIESQQQFLRAIATGLEVASRFTPMPLEAISRALAQFAAAGYINKWQHIDKLWARKRCRCVLSMELTMESFIANQLVYIEGELVGERMIAQSSPREGLWAEYLGKLTLSTNGVLEYKRASTVLSAFDLERKVFLQLADA